MDFQKNEVRGIHAHKQLRQVLLPIKGSMRILLNDGSRTKSIVLNVEDKTGLFIPNGIWREIESLSDDAALAVLADSKYNAADYIYDYQEFLEWKMKL
jgi:dTDP-4-dehydrorhamnose 3,5-epimerase-like enzyme